MTTSNESDEKVVRPARFKLSRSSELRKYFAEDALIIRCRQDVQGAVARAIDEIGILKTEDILAGVKSYIEMLKDHGKQP